MTSPRTCKHCGCDISDLHGRAKQCKSCAEAPGKGALVAQAQADEAQDYPKPDSADWTVEDLFTSEWGFKIETAMPVQRAMCRMVEGRPLLELESHPDVIEMCGGNVPDLLSPPRMLEILWAIRSAKSVFCVAVAFKRSQSIDVSGMIDSDQIRIPIVSTDKDTAKPTFEHLKVTMTSTPFLRTFVVDYNDRESFLVVRHPSGRLVEIRVVALANAGSTLVARYLPCVIFDEAPRMSSNKDHVRNLDDSIRAVRGRILPGGTILMPGSPNEPMGTAFNNFKRYFGKADPDCIVLKARGPVTNPFWWTPEQVAYVKRTDPGAFRTDCEADFLKPPNAFLDHRDLEYVKRAELVAKPRPRAEYSAALIAGTSRNVWTLIVEGFRGFREDGMPRFAIEIAHEWTDTGDDIVRAASVLKEIKRLLTPYGIDFLVCDEDTDADVIAQAERVGLILHPEDITVAEMLELIGQVKSLVESHRYEIPDVEDLKADLLAVRRKTTATGNKSIEMPETENERRCDYIPALVRARKYAAIPYDERERAEDDLAQAIRRTDERNSRGAAQQALHHLTSG